MVYRGLSVAPNCLVLSLLHSTTQPDVKASISARSLDETSLRLLLTTTVHTTGCSPRAQLIAAGTAPERLA